MSYRETKLHDFIVYEYIGNVYMRTSVVIIIITCERLSSSSFTLAKQTNAVK